MIEQLRELAALGGPVGERAQIALAITEQYQGGGLDTSEYQELMRDLARMDTVSDQAASIQVKTMLVTAIYGVAQLV